MCRLQINYLQPPHSLSIAGLQHGLGSGQHLLAQPPKLKNGTTTIHKTTNFATFFMRLPFQFN
jgi:hypothetical protein